MKSKIVLNGFHIEAELDGLLLRLRVVPPKGAEIWHMETVFRDHSSGNHKEPLEFTLSTDSRMEPLELGWPTEDFAVTDAGKAERKNFELAASDPAIERAVKGFNVPGFGPDTAKRYAEWKAKRSCKGER